MSNERITQINLGAIAGAVIFLCTTIFSAGVSVQKLNSLIEGQQNLSDDFREYKKSHEEVAKQVAKRVEAIERKLRISAYE